MEIRPYRREDERAVVRLWAECGLTRPWNDPRRDIGRKLTVQPAPRGDRLPEAQHPGKRLIRDE